MRDVELERVVLELYLTAVQALLANREALGCETSPDVKAYMSDLRALARRADDVLVCFRENEAGTCKLLRYFTGRSPLLLRLTTVRNMRKVLKEIRTLFTRTDTSGVTEKLATKDGKEIKLCTAAQQD